MKTPMRIVVLVTLCVVGGRQSSAAQQPGPTSPPIVSKLTAFLVTQHLDSLAIEDPSQPGQIVAVLHVPKVQLLLIRGRCALVDTLRARLATRAYRDVYSDLNSCAPPDTRLFIHDLGADGVTPDRSRDGAPFDIVYEHGTRQTRFDGDPKAQNLTEEEYHRRFSAIDAEYARLASLLLTGAASSK